MLNDGRRGEVAGEFISINIGDPNGYGTTSYTDVSADDIMKHDPVNHPIHYTRGGVECIEAIQAALTPEEFRGFCKGNALKYIWREKLKKGKEDIDKGTWYLQKLQEVT